MIAQDGRLDASTLEIGDVFVQSSMDPYTNGWVSVREYRVDRITKRDVVCLTTQSPEAEPLRLIRLNRNGVALNCFAPDDPALEPIRAAIRRRCALAIIKGMRFGDIDDELMQAIFAWRKRRDAKETVTSQPRG